MARDRVSRALIVVLFLTASLLGWLGTPRDSHAEDFRIETKIFVGDEKAPATETTTLFQSGDVFDFLSDPPQVAVFRKPIGDKPGRIILLHTGHRIRTELTTDKIGGAIEKLSDWAVKQPDPFLKFAANPEFKESFTKDDGKLTLASHLESYSVETAPAKHPQAVAEYREFLDWYARLNTLLSAGPPPGPRLKLNAALANHNVIPLKVELTRKGGKETLRAEHAFTWRLSQEDRQRIDGVRADLAAFTQVSNEEYRNRTQPQGE